MKLYKLMEIIEETSKKELEKLEKMANIKEETNAVDKQMVMYYKGRISSIEFIREHYDGLEME